MTTMTANRMFWTIGSERAKPGLLRIECMLLLARRPPGGAITPSLRSISALMMLQPKSAASTMTTALSRPRRISVRVGLVVPHGLHVEAPDPGEQVRRQGR